MASPLSECAVLVFGATGQVGRELPRALTRFGPVVSLDRHAADFSRPETLRTVVRHFRPRVIVNAAAYTAVDRAESEPDVAYLVNATAPGVLAEEAETQGACLVHYSTDYVFDGRKAAPYVEADAPNPLSVYGSSKLAGEGVVASRCGRHLILRTSWVLGVHGSNFLKTILRLARGGDGLRVVADQYGAPTTAALIADVTGRILQAVQDAPAANPVWGLYHLTAAGETSWHAYARHVLGKARQLGIPMRVTPDRVEPIMTADYPTAAARPANSRLSTARLRATFGLHLPQWECGVNEVLERLHHDNAQ